MGKASQCCHKHGRFWWIRTRVGYLHPPYPQWGILGSLILSRVSSAPPMGKVGRDCELQDVSQPYVKDGGEGEPASQLAGDCCPHQLSTFSSITISIRIPRSPLMRFSCIRQLYSSIQQDGRRSVQNGRFCGSALIWASFYLRPDLQPATKGG